MPHPRKILIVEDNIDMREMLHLYLITEGFSVITARDGREGLYMARAERPEVIITDINMPHLDGIELIKQLRAQSEFQNVPIIAFTAFGKESMDEAVRAGANRAVDKPTHFETLIDDINELLEESEQGRK